MENLANKIDELEALMRKNLKFEQCGLLCFPETWLQEQIPDSKASLDFRQYKSTDSTKQHGRREELQCSLMTDRVIHHEL